MTDGVKIAPLHGGRLRWAFSDSWTITLQDLIHWRQEPALIVWSLSFPIVYVLLFGVVLGSAMVVPGGGDYQEFLMPGLFASTMAFGIGGTMIAVNLDAAKGVTDRFRSMPMAPSAVVVGRSLADMLNSIVGLGLMMICGLVVGWRWNGTVAEALLAVALLLLLRFAFLWPGMYLGLLVRSPETAQNLFALLFPVTMIANTFVAPELLPGWLGAIAEWNPLSATVTATRELFGNPGVGQNGSWPTEHPMLMAIVWPVVLIAVFLPLSVRRYRRLSR